MSKPGLWFLKITKGMPYYLIFRCKLGDLDNRSNTIRNYKFDFLLQKNPFTVSAFFSPGLKSLGPPYRLLQASHICDINQR